MLDEAELRLTIFVSVLAAMALGEVLVPRRALALGRRARWPANFAITTLNTLCARIVVPGGAVAFAGALHGHSMGLLPTLGVSGWAAFAMAWALLDLAIYFQHRLFHAVPILWRLHRMHHSDIDLDVTSGARFHPVEILLSLAIKLVVVAALGAPPEAVLAFEITLNACAMFNHANINLGVLERSVRMILVTPDLHRIHHSIIRAETDSNFGFSVPWWDRLFGTYRAQPDGGQDALVLGIPEFRDRAAHQLGALLTQPLRTP